MATRMRVAEYSDAATECGENQQEKKGQPNTALVTPAFGLAELALPYDV
jgi:hypothetical protein